MLAAPHCLRSFDECQNCRSRRDAQAIMPPVSSSRTPTAAETDRLEAKTAVLELGGRRMEAPLQLHSALPSYVVTAVQVVSQIVPPSTSACPYLVTICLLSVWLPRILSGLLSIELRFPSCIDVHLFPN